MRPLLAVAAVDVMAGELRLFDSDAAPLEARHVAASSAIPLLYDPVEIDGRLFWDGEVTRDSMLPLLLQRLLHSGRVAAQHCRVIREPLPEDGVSGQFDYAPARILHLLQQGRDAARQALGLDGDASDAAAAALEPGASA